MKLPLALLLVLAVAFCAGTAGAQTQPPAQSPRSGASNAPVKVIYHLTSGLEEAQHAMANIRNHLRADPTAKIVVIGNGKGIDFMLDGAKDRNGYPFDAMIQQYKAQGVDFRLCAHSLTARKLDPSKVVPDVTIIESGVAEVARLQAKEGFVYLHP
jgi:uncharacterized protein